MGALFLLGGISVCLWHWFKSWNDGIPSSGSVYMFGLCPWLLRDARYRLILVNIAT